MNDECPIIPDFDKQVAAINDLAKVLVPTRNKENVTSFMQAVERMFRERSWNFSDYCKKVSIESFDKKQSRKGINKVDEAANDLSQEMKNILDNMSDGSLKSAK